MKNKAFTLAEVLITLGIIGIVAAMTMPSLTAYYRKKVVETRLAKFYSSVNQAIKMAEVDYGDVNLWDKLEGGFEKDENGNPTTSKAIFWFEKYLKPYLKFTKYEVDQNSEGQVVTYFADGSLFLLSANSVIFYTNAKDYKLMDNNGTLRRKSVSGTKYFTFNFSPLSSTCNAVGKGIEPYMCNWNGTKEMLLNNDVLGCKQEVSNERAYCTKLIQMSGWKIPKDYPLRF